MNDGPQERSRHERSSQQLSRPVRGLLPFRIIAIALFLIMARIAAAEEETMSIVWKAANREAAMLASAEPVLFTDSESSKRTSGHLWDEVVVRTEHGEVRRLTAIDGVPLTPRKLDQEYGRAHDSLRALLDHRLQPGLADDRQVLMTFAQMMPKAFIFTPNGSKGDCLRFRFSGNPAFVPQSHQERALRAFEGSIAISRSGYQICRLDAKAREGVDFGALGRPGDSSIHLIQGPAGGSSWEILVLDIHMGGPLPVIGTSRDYTSIRSHFRPLPRNLDEGQIMLLLRGGAQEAVVDHPRNVDSNTTLLAEVQRPGKD